MITILHRGGYAQMITILHGGQGSLGTPKSDYIICARPLINLNHRVEQHAFSAAVRVLWRIFCFILQFCDTELLW